MLAARAGSRGKPGERGPKGERGERGIGVEQVTADGYALVLALSDGKTLKLDLRGMFERYDQERGG
jgi:integrin beta 3